MKIKAKGDYDSIQLLTKIRDKTTGVLYKIQILKGRQPTKSSRNAPQLIRTGTQSIETYSLQFRNTEIGEIKVSPKGEFIDWLHNRKESQYGRVGKALLEFTSKLQKLRDPQYSKATTCLEATTGTSLYYFNFGFRFLESKKNKIMAEKIKTTNPQDIQTRRDLPVGDMMIRASSFLRNMEGS